MIKFYHLSPNKSQSTLYYSYNTHYVLELEVHTVWNPYIRRYIFVKHCDSQAICRRSPDCIQCILLVLRTLMLRYNYLPVHISSDNKSYHSRTVSCSHPTTTTTMFNVQ